MWQPMHILSRSRGNMPVMPWGINGGVFLNDLSKNLLKPERKNAKRIHKRQSLIILNFPGRDTAGKGTGTL